MIVVLCRSERKYTSNEAKAGMTCSLYSLHYKVLSGQSFIDNSDASLCTKVQQSDHFLKHTQRYERKCQYPWRIAVKWQKVKHFRVQMKCHYCNRWFPNSHREVLLYYCPRSMIYGWLVPFAIFTGEQLSPKWMGCYVRLVKQWSWWGIFTVQTSQTEETKPNQSRGPSIVSVFLFRFSQAFM